MLVNVEDETDFLWLDLSVPSEVRIPGVTFLLEGVSDYGNRISLLKTTDSSGRLVYENLDKGTYTLKEFSANENYLINKTVWKFRIDDTGEARLIDLVEKDRLWQVSRNGRYYVIYDEPAVFSFELRKVDYDNETVALPGAEYGLYDNNGLVASAVSNNLGFMVFTGIAKGTYLLKEIKAPVKGNIRYQLNQEPIILRVDEKGKVHMDPEKYDEYGNLLVTDRKAYEKTIVITKKWHDGLTDEERPIPVIHLVTANPFENNNAQVNVTRPSIDRKKLLNDTVNLTSEIEPGNSVEDGTDGTCNWVLYDNGLLEFSAGTLSNTHSWQQYKDQITHVKFNGLLVLPMTVAGLFENFKSLVSCQFEQVDASALTNMDRMFRNCTSLTSLDMSMFTETALNSMANSFAGCTELESIDIGNLDVSEVTSMASLFSGTGLKSIDLSNWNTASLQIMGNMFNGCKSLESVQLNFDTSNAAGFSGMFRDCSALKSLDLTSFSTPKVKNMDYMFYGCKELSSLVLGDFCNDITQNMSNMFYNCGKLTGLDLSSFHTPSATNMNNMFYSCSSLNELDLTSFDTSNVTLMANMFNACNRLQKVDLSSFDTSNVQKMEKMFYQCRNLKSVDLSSFSYAAVTTMNKMFAVCTSLGKLVIGQGMPELFSTVSLSGNWVRKYDGNGNRLYDSQTITAAQLMALTGEEASGTWVKPGYVEYYERPDGAYEYISEDKGWIRNGDEWTYVFDVLDDSIGYWMYEETLPGYESDVMYPGYRIIRNSAVIDNYGDTGSLTVRKTVENIETERKFRFEILLEGVADHVIFDNVLFENGRAEISLGNNEARTIRYLPANIRYTVNELDSEGYEVISTNAGGFIGDNTAVSFINRYIPEETHQKVTIRKNVTGRWEEDFLYKLTVYLENLGRDWKNGDIQADENGRCLFEVSLKNGEEYVIDDLPVNSLIQVSEEAGEYVSSYLIYDNNNTGHILNHEERNKETNTALATKKETVDPNEDLVIAFTNDVMVRHDIAILKHSNKAGSYDFTAYLNNLIPGESYSSSAGLIRADEYGNAVKRFTLSDGEKFEIKGLPSGSTYHISEDSGNYETDYLIRKKGITVEEGEGSRNTQVRTLYGGDEVVEFTNLVTENWLTVRKNVEGNMADRFSKFAFRLKVCKNGQPLNNIDVNINGTVKEMTTGLSGYYEFDLGHGDEISFAIPVDGDIELMEMDSRDYLTSIEVNGAIFETGSYSTGVAEDMTVTFINKREVAVPTAVNVRKSDLLGSLLPGAALLIMFLVRRHR